MYTFIKSALVLLLLAAAAVYPGVQAKPVENLVQASSPKDVVSLHVGQNFSGILRATWTVAPPGNQSHITLYNVTTQQLIASFPTMGLTEFFMVTPGHTYLVSVAHGQNMMSETIVVF